MPISLNRYIKNPILSPNKKINWQEIAVFNGSVIKENNEYYLIYRAVSGQQLHQDKMLNLSTIGTAKSTDGINFSQNHQLIKPEEDWEKYGCEDPRVTKIDNKFFIFYTALSQYPPTPQSIKVGLAISENLKTIKEKHLVTPFNAKAMVLFPEKINNHYTAILTIDTDNPPAKIAIASFKNEEDIWSQTFWQKWYQEIDKYVISITRLNTDQVEVGAVPIKTEKGWLLIYAHIQNYYQEDKRIFGIEAVLLDQKNPQQIIGRTDDPLLIPEKDYELFGQVPNVIFPSGGIIKNDKQLYLYYGATDTTCALAICDLDNLLTNISNSSFKTSFKLTKHQKNPILSPQSHQSWQSKAVFNPGVIYLNNKIYLIYRALSEDNTSTFGCVSSHNGINFTPYSNEPIYVPRMNFELKKTPGILSGCEDPRITKIEDKFYMFYTAYNGVSEPKVALTSISVDNFINQQWFWSKPVLVSSPGISNKNACVFPEKINGEYIIFHRLGGKEIVIDYRDNLDFDNEQWLQKNDAIHPRAHLWDSKKIGITGPPIKTEKGWLLLYHGVSEIDKQYRLGFMLLDLYNPAKVLFRTKYPILEPTTYFEKKGLTDNVVFSCGSVKIGNILYVYYGAADKVICLATADIDKLLDYAD